jgi:hypothetical protein
MKTIAVALLFGASLFASAAAYADADDAKWVARCVKDNQNEKASVEVITKYCTCMNNKMDANETQSISTWEKTHPAEMKACDREAGWR